MYTVTKNTKLTSLVLMLIGVVALGYGFIQGAGHLTDEDVTLQVEAFAHDLQLHISLGLVSLRCQELRT